MIIKTWIKTGEYRDSVALLLIARDLQAMAGVVDVAVVMGTPANQTVLRQAGLLSGETGTATPNDLLVAVKAQTEATAQAALDQARVLLSRHAATTPTAGASRPQTMRGAIRATPEANIAVISVPGQYAAAQAWDALRAGLHVFLFSDHVAIQDEIALKEYARDHDLLVMGPGAGTAIIDGVGLGFANAVPRGNIGIVAAAGTGLQEVSTLIAKDGAGITQAIGVGGRDVSERVGGMMLLAGLKTLQTDPDTRVIVIISKMPAASVVEHLLGQIGRSDKPTVLALMTNDASEMSDPQFRIPNVEVARDLREAAVMAAALSCGESVSEARKRLALQNRSIGRRASLLRRKLSARQRYLRGLYSGGTLCEETMRIWQATLGGIWSNAPLDPRFKLPDSSKSKCHTVVDLGEEEFTLGRPHPMIDSTLRVKRILDEARDPNVAAIVLDVVIGFGAHPDPASELAPAIAQAREIAAKHKRELFVIASVTGTEQDLQNLKQQIKTLKSAGTLVLDSNAQAAKFASALVQ